MISTRTAQGWPRGIIPGVVALVSLLDLELHA